MAVNPRRQSTGAFPDGSRIRFSSLFVSLASSACFLQHFDSCIPTIAGPLIYLMRLRGETQLRFCSELLPAFFWAPLSPAYFFVNREVRSKRAIRLLWRCSCYFLLWELAARRRFA